MLYRLLKISKKDIIYVLENMKNIQKISLQKDIKEVLYDLRRAV